MAEFAGLPILYKYYNQPRNGNFYYDAGQADLYTIFNASNEQEVLEHAKPVCKSFGKVFDISLNQVLANMSVSPRDNQGFSTQISLVCDYTNDANNWQRHLSFSPNGLLSIPLYDWGNWFDTNDAYFYMYAVALYASADDTDLIGFKVCILVEFRTLNSVGGNTCISVSNEYLRARHSQFDVTIPDITDEDMGETSEQDGYGQGGTTPAFNHSSDIISIPDMPAVSTSSVGFIHLYKVDRSSLATLSQYLFPDIMTELQNIIAQLPVALSDLPNVLVPMLRAFASIFAYRDSVQYIIDLHAIPVPPSVSGSDYIKVGALSTDITAPVITSDYVDIDCGALSISEQFQNFLDYMVACKLFLPFIGFIDIKPELWNGGTIGVKYRFNVIDGSFMCYVSSTSGKSNLTNTVIGQYGGSACLHLPMVAAEYGAIIGGIVQGAMAVDKVSGAGSASQMASAEAGLASALMNFNANPPMQQSNGYNASAGFMGGRTPYLMIEYPVPQLSAKYRHEKGLPLNVSMPLNKIHGYTEIDANIDLSGINAPVDIIDEIRSALSSGTIF